MLNHMDTLKSDNILLPNEKYAIFLYIDLPSNLKGSCV
jgi:hypothetical protein